MQLFVDVVKTIILGIVQGITEWLPISSTGHLILFQDIMNYRSANITDAFTEMFEVVIQLGSILAVLILYFHKLNPFSSRKTVPQKKETLSIWAKVLVAAIPAAVIGFLFDDFLDKYLFNVPVISATLVIYGILFIIIENVNKHRDPSTAHINSLSYKTALLIGVFQILALIPGTSRSGSTILGAIILGCSRGVAAEFSFFLAVPIMFGASSLKLVKFFAENGAFTGEQVLILSIGTIISFVVSVFAINFLVNFVKKHDFKVFGYYRIVLGVLLIVCLAVGIL